MNDTAAIRMGTRGSDLARTQSGHIAARITELTGRAVETIIITTRGDRIQDVPLDRVEGKGFFTKEIEEALLGKQIDIAVHSLKDLPTVQPQGLTIAVIPVREDPCDLLLIRDDAWREDQQLHLPAGASVGTSSRRRALQILSVRGDLRTMELRGNVPTRVRKLQDGQYDAIVIASAGYRRLGMRPEGYRAVPLSLAQMIPAPGQGALAVQTREDDAALIDILRPLHDADTAQAVAAERLLLELLGGGCGTPLGAYAQIENGKVRLNAVVGNEHWQAGMPPLTTRVDITGDDIAGAAEQARRGLAGAFHGAGTWTRSRAPRLFMPVIVNGAAVADDFFAGLPIEFHPLPLLAIESLLDESERADLRNSLNRHDWVLFGSANAARQFFAAVDDADFGKLRFACVGPGTATEVARHGRNADFVPETHTAEAFAREFITRFGIEPQRVLLPRAEKVSGDLQGMLEGSGFSVQPLVLYRTAELEKIPPVDPAPAADDLFVFRSPSAVRAFISRYPLPAAARVVAIGPTTAASLRNHGHERIIVAHSADREGLVDTVRKLLESIL